MAISSISRGYKLSDEGPSFETPNFSFSFQVMKEPIPILVMLVHDILQIRLNLDFTYQMLLL